MWAIASSLKSYVLVDVPTEKTLLSSKMKRNLNLERVRTSQPEDSNYSLSDSGGTGTVGGDTSSGETLSKKKHRGPTRLAKVFDRKEGEPKPSIEFDGDGQHVGTEASTFAHTCGIILRTPARVPWSKKNWDLVDDSIKDWLWESIKDRLEIEENMKKGVIDTHMRETFRKTKARWKRRHYTCYNTDEERKRNKPPDCVMDEWGALMQVWDTPEAQAISEKNAVNRSKQEIKNIGGTKSSACYRHDLIKTNGVAPSDGDMFIRMHTRYNNHASDPKSKDLIDELCAVATEKNGGILPTSIDDATYNQVMPPQHSGRKRFYGPGVTAKTRFGSTSTQFSGTTSSQIMSMQLELEEHRQRELTREEEYMRREEEHKKRDDEYKRREDEQQRREEEYRKREEEQKKIMEENRKRDLLRDVQMQQLRDMILVHQHQG